MKLEDYPELDKWLDDITQAQDERWCFRGDVEVKVLEMQQEIDMLKAQINENNRND